MKVGLVVIVYIRYDVVPHHGVTQREVVPREKCESRSTNTVYAVVLVYVALPTLNSNCMGVTVMVVILWVNV